LWNVLLSFSGLVALIQLLFLPFFPESPPYLLLQKGDKNGCLEAMKQLWGEGNYHTEFEDMLKERAATKGTKIMNVLEVLKEPSVRRQLSIMLLLLLSIQLCGLKIFRTANIQESIIPYVSLGVAISELFSIIFCSSIIDRFGRRILLWGGYLLMALILVLFETSLQLSDQFSWMRYCSVILIFLFIIAYGIGP
ncbi:Solute carrier family 2, facilitated glucose transporter member 11, partial [Struthio camelus australis]